MDALEVDVSEATIVTLYLLSSSNAKLRPILTRQLPAGEPGLSRTLSAWAIGKPIPWTASRTTAAVPAPSTSGAMTARFALSARATATLLQIAGVAKWQTRRTQNPVGFTLRVGFESHLRHKHLFRNANAEDEGHLVRACQRIFKRAGPTSGGIRTTTSSSATATSTRASQSSTGTATSVRSFD